MANERMRTRGCFTLECRYKRSLTVTLETAGREDAPARRACHTRPMAAKAVAIPTAHLTTSTVRSPGGLDAQAGSNTPTGSASTCEWTHSRQNICSCSATQHFASPLPPPPVPRPLPLTHERQEHGERVLVRRRGRGRNRCSRHTLGRVPVVGDEKVRTICRYVYTCKMPRPAPRACCPIWATGCSRMMHQSTNLRIDNMHT